MISFIITALKVIFLLGFLVLIHEGGHFLVAKLCKVQVNEFAIGFGPTIWKSKNTKTKYALRLIPLGGFVSMEGEEERSDKEGSFSKASIPKRIAIVMAGGTVNIVFGLIVYFILASTQGGGYVSNVVDTINPEYGAYGSGIIAGDKVVKINGKAIHNKQDITNIMEKSEGNDVVVEVKRNGEIMKFTVKPTAIPSQDTGIYLGAEGDSLTTKIVALYPESPAEKQGIKVNDVILKVNGNDVENDPYKVVEFIQANEDEQVVFTLLRDNETIEIKVTPERTYTYLLGITFKLAEENFANNIYYGFWDTVDFSGSIIENLKMLFTGHVSTDQLMGPIGISGIVAETKEVVDFIYILALISLSLGVTNLLPFPPLDGGKIVIYLVEAIRRKPISEKTEMAIQSAGFLLIIALTIFVTYNDILRVF